MLMTYRCFGEVNLNSLANIMERGKTEDIFIRNIYRNFLKESFDLLNFQPLLFPYNSIKMKHDIYQQDTKQ